MQRIIHCRVFEGEIASILTEIVSQKKCDYSLLKKSFNSKKQNNFVLKKMKQIDFQFINQTLKQKIILQHKHLYKKSL